MITVRLIHIFDGERHERLRTIWETIAEYAADLFRLRWFRNDQNLSHADALNAIWSEECEEGENRLVITEHDFLPDLAYDDWLLQTDFQDPQVALTGACYAKRAPGTREIHNYTHTVGPWFMSIDKTRVPDRLNFRGQTDPAEYIGRQIDEVGGVCVLYPGFDPYPQHVGVEYLFGTHLFWSRHYNDPPTNRVSGYKVGDIQEKHDRFVAAWIKAQPPEFQELLAKRSKLGTWASSFEPMLVRTTFVGSSGKLSSSDTVEVPVFPS